MFAVVRLRAQLLSPVCSPSLLSSRRSPSPLAAGDKVRLVDIPLAEMILNPCTNEMVTIVGSTNLTLYTKVQKNGALDVTLRIASRGDGTAQSAYGGGLVPYRLPLGGNDANPRRAERRLRARALAKTMLIRKGELGEDIVSQDDWIFKHTIRVKQDEFGNVLAFREYTYDSCPVD